jgi:hypothetical protein
MPVPPSLKTARTTLVSRRADTANALLDRENARQARDEAKRTNSPDLGRLEADVVSTQNDLDFARAGEAAARQDLNNQIKSWLTIPNTTTLMEPDPDYARMGNLDAPVTMFPVRLGTASTFRMRCCIAHLPRRDPVRHPRARADAHRAEARAPYWDGPRTNSEPAQASAVDAARKDFGQRAAYIVHATEPRHSRRRARPYPAAPRAAVLPDRFVAVAFRGGARSRWRGLRSPSR